VREETLRRAVVALVDYHHSLPLSAAFGPGTTAMSDGIRFEVGAHSLHAQHHARYFGPRRGVTLHDGSNRPRWSSLVLVVNIPCDEGLT
jgi:TnpA family transposase